MPLLDPDLSQPQELHRFHMMPDVQRPSVFSSSVTLFKLDFLSHVPPCFRTLVFGRLPHREPRSVCVFEPLDFAEQLTHSPRPCDSHEDTKVPVKLPAKDLHPKNLQVSTGPQASDSKNPYSFSMRRNLRWASMPTHDTPGLCNLSSIVFSQLEAGLRGTCSSERGEQRWTVCSWAWASILKNESLQIS